MATITQLIVKAIGSNGAGGRGLYLIDEAFIGYPLPEPNPVTGIVEGEILLPVTSFNPNPEILKLVGLIENTLALEEEALPEKGSKARLYRVRFAVAKNNPAIAHIENTYFIPRRFVAVFIDNNGFATLLGDKGAAGRVDRSASTGADIGTDRNELLYEYTVEMREAAPFYTSLIADDIFNITY